MCASAMGPKTYFGQFAQEVDEAFNKILAAAQQSIQTDLTLHLSVNINAEASLQQKLVAAGFASVMFEAGSQFGAAFMTVRGNPYAPANVQREAGVWIEKIRSLLTGKQGSAGYVSVSIDIPRELRDTVKAAYLAKGWTQFTFNDSQRDESSITLQY